MAKQVTIAELLVRIKVDAKASAKALREQKKKIETLQKQVDKSNKAQQTADQRRNQNLKVYLAGSRELHKLRKAAPKEALKYEKQLERAYKSNNKARQAEIKKNIGLALQEKRVNEMNKKNAPAVKERQRMQNLKTYLAGSKEFYKLQTLSPKAAAMFEKRLTAAYKANDKVRIASAKKGITLKLEGIRATQRAEKEAAKAAAKAIRENERASERQRKAEERTARVRAMEAKRAARAEQQRLAQLSKLRKNMLSSFSGATGGLAGGAASGAGSAAAVAGAVGLSSATQLLEFRRAEAAAESALRGSGSKSSFDEISKQIQRNADFYGINRAQHLSSFAGMRAAVGVDKLSDNQIMYGTQALAETAKISGATQAQVSLATRGLLQMLTSGIQGQEIQQITENLGSASPALYRAIGKLAGVDVSTYGEVMTLQEAGKLRNISGSKVVMEFFDELTKMNKGEFEKRKGTFPFELEQFTNALNAAQIQFAAGFESEMVKLLMKGTAFFRDNAEEIRAFGETVGEVVNKLIEIADELYTRFEPFFTMITKAFLETSAKDLVDYAINLGLVLAAFKALSIAGSVAGGLLKLADALGKLDKLTGKRRGRGGRGGAGGAGDAGGGAGGSSDLLTTLLSIGAFIPALRWPALIGLGGLSLHESGIFDTAPDSTGVPPYISNGLFDSYSGISSATNSSKNTVTQNVTINGNVTDKTLDDFKSATNDIPLLFPTN